MKRICLNCRWWGNVKGLVEDESSNMQLPCRRSPPVVVPVARVHNPCGPSGPSVETEFPTTTARCLCGGWAADGLPRAEDCLPMPPGVGIYTAITALVEQNTLYLQMDSEDYSGRYTQEDKRCACILVNENRKYIDELMQKSRTIDAAGQTEANGKTT